MIDILVPAEQEGTKAVVRSWLKRIGDPVAIDDPLVELETDKVTQEVSSRYAGILAEIVLGTDAEATPGALLGRLSGPASANGTSDGDIAVPEAPAAGRPGVEEAGRAGSAGSGALVALSPAVRRAVRQHGVDAAQVPGTGRGGRVTRADVDLFVANREENASSAEPTPPGVIEVGGDTSSPKARSVPHDRMRRTIAQNMLNSVTTAPHVTAVFECDFSAIMTHRRKHQTNWALNGVNLTYTAYVVVAAASAMKAAPAVNSRWFDDRLEIYDDVNIGIGTALGDEGLVVPVVPRVQNLSLLGVATRLSNMTARARAKKLTPADMRGGTFTISNHGVSGSLLATPIIINQPQSAILGIGKLEKRVVVREVGGADSTQIRPLCYVSLTIDHRVIDGHQTNAWLTAFVKAIEEWPFDA